MNIVFVGSLYPKYLIEYLLNSGISVSFAANNFQKALIEGFASYCDKVTIVSSPYITRPDACEKHYIEGGVLTKEESGYHNFHYVGNNKVRNLRLISELVRIRKALKIVLCPKMEENFVCCYSLHSPFLLAILSLQRRIKKTCVVVPDLPEYMSSKGNLLRSVAKRIDRRIINFCVRRLNCFALLSKAMADKLPLTGKQWVLVEGIYCPTTIPNVKKSENKVILYTGQLQRRYGLFDLVDAFMMIPNKDYELWLCGRGGTEEQIWFENKAREDRRIKIIGRVPPEEALILQKKATLLVNPRHSNEEFTKYSFPSKTMEYLASGTPTLMCRLPSIPEEYYDYLFFFEDESIVGMSRKMMEVCQMDTAALEQKGRNASDFIMTTKNPNYQVGKIIKILQ